MVRERGVLVAVLLCVLTSASAFADCGAFFDTPLISSVTNTTMRDVLLEDVTGDGRRDVVLAGYSLGYLPAVGRGLAFRELVTIDELAVDVWVPSIAAADFDGDADNDLVTFEFAPYAPAGRRVRVYRNDRGTFTPTVAFPVSSFEGGRVFAGDFNGDGGPDIAFAAGGGTSLRVYLRGADNFTESTLATGTDALRGDGAMADLDGDGYDDLVLGKASSVLLLFGGSSQFRAPVEIATGANYGVQIADIDGDAVLDVAYQTDPVGEPLRSRRFGWIANPAGPAPRHAVILLTAPYADFARFLFTDLTGDRIADIAQAGSFGSLRVSRATGPGTYVRAPDQFAETDAWYYPNGMEAADLDDDGDRDVVLLGRYKVVVLRNDGVGGLRSPRAFGDVATLFHNGVADLDGDGRVDILSRTEGWISQGDGTFTRKVSTATLPQTLLGNARFADFNGDGHADYLYLFNDGLVLTRAIGLGRGDGTFSHRVDLFPERRSFGEPLVADLDLDGRMDVLAYTQVPAANPSTENNVAFGNGDGTFDPWQAIPPAFGLVGGTSAVADFNGDTRPDLYLGGVHLNLGTSYAPSTPSLPFGQNAYGDLNHDGFADAVGASSGTELGPHMYFLEGRGNGTFEDVVRKPLPVTISPHRSFIRDFDGDGHPDILVTERHGISGAEGLAVMFRGDGTGSFAPGVVVHTSNEGEYAVGDFDGDGRPDLLDGVYVRLNVCGSSPRRRGVRH